jgi:diaminobutyrate-2-oxoglutarate transaminase
MLNESGVNGYAAVFPAEFKTASGEIITDSEGREYLDFFSGASVMNYGHNNPKLKRAAISFLENDRLVHCLDMDTVMKRSFLDKFLSTILRPRGLDYHVQFSGPTGTNAVEAAIKLARGFTRRKKVVAFTNSFHGMTATSLALSASQEDKQSTIPSQDVIFFPYDQYLDEYVDSFEYLKGMILTKGSGVGLPAAIILETVQAEGGINIARNKWLQDMRLFTEKYNIVLIVDDIQVGCGRAGDFFSFERAGIVPDIVLLSKSISGFGLPLALVLIKPELDIWRPGEHNGTFRANNLSICTATEALDFWEGEAFKKAIASKSYAIRQSLDNLLQSSEHVTAVRGIGMIWGIEFRDRESARKVSKQLFHNGMIIETCGNKGQVIKLLPPLTISEENLNRGLDMITDNVIHADASKPPYLHF